MNNIWKRSLSVLLALVMVVGMLPMNALAAEEASGDYAESEVIETDVPDCAEGHTWGLWEPTEDESAEYRVCAVCGETETYVYEVEETVVAAAQASAEEEKPEPADLADAEGIIWMDEDKHNNSGNGYFKGQIMKGNLDNIIRKAVGLDYDNEDIKVTYDGMDVGNIYALAMYQDKLNKLQDDLTNAVTNHQLVTFNVGGTDKDIAFLNILSVSVQFANEEINGKAAPAGLADQVAAKLAAVENSVQIKHYDQNYVISLDEAGADISAYTNDYAWPEAGEEVVAAEVAVTIYDSVDGEPYTKYGEVVLKDTRKVFAVAYLDEDGSVLLSESVVENEATPVCNPTRTYYTLSWDKKVAATVTEDVTYTAVWTPNLDVNGNKIADQEESFTVSYVDGLGNTLLEKSVKWGKATPSCNPSRQYYTFEGWDKEVAATVTENATYTAVWKAINDHDGDNIANEEEHWTVTYVDEDGSEIASYSILWGEATQMPDDPERPDTGYRFGGWSPAVAAKVTGNAEYTATWTNSSIVTFDMYGFVFTQPANAENKVGNPTPDTDDDGVVWEGWFYTNENGVEVQWDFNNKVEKDITLVAKYADDIDNDGLADGTAEDPFIEYVFVYTNPEGVSFEMERISSLSGETFAWLNEDNTIDATKKAPEDTDDDGYIFLSWREPVVSGKAGNLVYTYYAENGYDRNNNGVQDGGMYGDPVTMYDFYVKGENVAHVDWLKGEPEVNPDDYIPVLTAPEVFDGWDVKKDVAPSNDVIYTYTANIINDANGNGTPDEEEVDKLVLNTEIGQLVNGVLFDAHGNKIEVQNGGENQLMKNAEGELIFSLQNDTIIKVTPAEGYYVNDITLTGPNTAGWVLEWNDDYSATYAKASVYLRAGVANNAEESAYTINVDLQPVEFQYKINNNNLELDITKVAEYDAEKIYNELISNPGYAEGTVTVAYLDARSNVAEEYRTVHLHKIIEDLVSDGNIVSAAKGFVAETIVVDLDDAWVDVDGESSTYYQTADEAAIAYLDANGFLDANGKIIVDNLIAAVDTLEDDLTNAVQNNTMLSPFSYIEEGKEWDLRSLRITFANKKFTIVDDDCTVQLKETRSEVSIAADPMTLSYYQVNDDVLKNNVKVIDKNGDDVTAEVKDYIKLSYDKNVGVNTVSVELPQTGAYKAAKGSFQLTVKPTAVSFEVPNVAIAMDEVNNFTFEAVKPVVSPANFTDYVQIIAGVDVSGLDLDVQKNPTEVDLNNVQIKAWIKLPAGLYTEVMNAAGLGTGFHTVDQIKAALAGTPVDGKLPLDKITSALDKGVGKVEEYLHNKVGIETELTICFESDAVPNTAGAYINYVTTMDALLSMGGEESNAPSNYDITPGTGIIVIHPLVVLPNNGIQLFLDETSNTQNIFEIIIDGENKNLGILHNGAVLEDDVYYFGVTTHANLYMETVGPKEAGIYVAAAVSYDGDTKLGSDMAVMLLAPEISNIEVDSQEIKYDGEAHKLVPAVTDSKGNVLTEGVGITMITGSVAVDAGSTNVGLSDISANLNIDFPKALDDAWNTYVASNYDVPEEITVQTVLNFLDWCKTQIDTKVPVDLLTKVVDQSYITKAQDYAKAGIEKIKAQLEKLPDVNATVTFEDNKQFTEHGIYVYCGVVTDPDLLPDANAGVLVIYTADTFLMKDTVKVYNGQEQYPDIIDETGRDRIDMIVDRTANRVNFIMLDADAEKLIAKIEEKLGVTINGNEIALQELYDRSGKKAEDLANTIIDFIWEQVPERLTNRFPGAADKVEEMIEKLEAKLPGVRTKLINKLVELDKLPDDLTLAFNKPGAIEVGTYEFHSFSYEIGHTTAMLEIIEEEQLGTIGLGEWRMDLDSVVYLNYYPALEGFSEGFDFANRGGVVLWTGESAPTSRYAIEDGKPNTVTVPGMRQNQTTGEWYVRTDEIFAKNLGDIHYIRPYITDVNGEMIYLDGAPYYSPAEYCYDILKNMAEEEDTRYVCAALLEYGASAQTYFDWKTGNLVTSIPAEYKIDMSIYDLSFQSSYLNACEPTAHVRSIAGTLSGIRLNDANQDIITHNKQTLDLQGAIRLSVGFDIDKDVIAESEIKNAVVMFWTEDQIAVLSDLSDDTVNASNTYFCEMTKAPVENDEYAVYLGEYMGKSDHILAKNLGGVVYYSCRIEMNDGTVYRSGLGYYSPEKFVEDHLNDGVDNKADPVCERIAVYGEMARKRFAEK